MSILSIFMTIFVTLGAAHAGIAEDCYAAAETDNYTLDIGVEVGSKLVLRSGDLDAVFDTIAQYHDEPQLTVRYNSAGRKAITDSLRCIFDAEATTLSAVIVNERFDALRVRARTVQILDSSGLITATLSFDKFESSNCVGNPTIHLLDDHGPQSLSMAGSPLGSHDMIAAFGPGDLGGTLSDWPLCTPYGYCRDITDPEKDGICTGECDSETGKSTCRCEGVGACGPSSGNEVATFDQEAIVTLGE
jgi:hypothetical protein